MRPETPLFTLAAFALAPLLLSVINRTKAFFAGRTGAPLLQPYYDLWKLLRKGAVYSTTTTWVFRAGPMVGLAAVATAMLLTPSGNVGAAIGFPGDLVALAGLLALARMFTMLAALDTGSSFEGMGASREARFSSLAEPALFLALMVLVVVSGSLSLTGMMGAIAPAMWATTAGPVLALAAAALFLVLLAENARIPVDDPNTHLELTMVHEVMVLDHSGPDLGYIMYGAALKLWVFASLIIGILLPVRTGVLLLDGGVFLAGMLVVAAIVGVVESSMARLRMRSVPNLLIGAGGLGALAVALALVVG
ncbi:MAG: NADH-quinone oxidoreductase subunit H [Dehalococcoidia bacterium]|nr:NADH-quinone oxidoreductase subunit H [Dehalococcoidia bacterium]